MKTEITYTHSDLHHGTVLNDLLWQATRYCIGRRSYVSGLAQDYARIIRRNRDKFSEK